MSRVAWGLAELGLGAQPPTYQLAKSPDASTHSHPLFPPSLTCSSPSAMEDSYLRIYF